MSALEGHNPAIQADIDCILDRPTALKAILIALFFSLAAYLYQSGPIHWWTLANAIVKLEFAIRARFGVEVFFRRWVFMFR